MRFAGRRAVRICGTCADNMLSQSLPIAGRAVDQYAAFAEQKRSGVSGTAPSKAKKKWFQRGVVAPLKMAAEVLGAEAGGGSIEGMAIASGESGSNPSWLLAEEFSRAGWVRRSNHSYISLIFTSIITGT